MPKTISRRLPVNQQRANKLAGLAFALFLLVIAITVMFALEIPSKAATQAGRAMGRAGFVVNRFGVDGLRHMDGELVNAVVMDELRRAFPDFERAYQPEGLRVEEFDAFPPTARTLRAFVASYHELLHQVTDAMIPNPDVRSAS